MNAIKIIDLRSFLDSIDENTGPSDPKKSAQSICGRSFHAIF